MKEWLNRFKIYPVSGAIIILAGLYYWLGPSLTSQPASKDNADWELAEERVPKEEQAGTGTESIIMADIKGAVKTPGVYQAAEGERVIDLINKAGGLTPSADASKVNFSMRITDEMVVYVPELGEEVEGVSGAFGELTDDVSDVVNINTAEAGELETLPGIGPSKSAAIIEYREKNGPFKAVEDLKQISGIGDKTYEKLESMITVR